MREKIISEYEIERIIDFGEKVIFDNVTRQTHIYIIRKRNNSKLLEID
jgi:hypothetical protein